MQKETEKEDKEQMELTENNQRFIFNHINDYIKYKWSKHLKKRYCQINSKNKAQLYSIYKKKLFKIIVKRIKNICYTNTK